MQGNVQSHPYKRVGDSLAYCAVHTDAKYGLRRNIHVLWDRDSDVCVSLVHRV